MNTFLCGIAALPPNIVENQITLPTSLSTNKGTVICTCVCTYAARFDWILENQPNCNTRPMYVIHFIAPANSYSHVLPMPVPLPGLANWHAFLE